MKKLIYSLFVPVMFFAACQAEPAKPARPPLTADTATPAVEIDETPSPTPTAEEAAPVFELSPFLVDLSDPLSEGASLTTWQPGVYSGADYTLPVSMSETYNPEVLEGLTSAQRQFLSQNGFVVIHSQEESFISIRESVSKFQGQPYFLTVDSALHAVHLEFDEALKSIERQLNHTMAQMLVEIIDLLESEKEFLNNTSIETDADQALAYLYVGLSLFNPYTEVPDQYTELVGAQLDLIYAGEGRGDSLILPDFEDDYGAYKPVGHYFGDPDLEKYFRGMTWLGRVHFRLTPETGDPSRAPLLITYALRASEESGGHALYFWSDLHQLLSFLIGPMDDAGPIEYAALMDQVYGTSISITTLADDDLWAEFLAQADQLPAPQINSTFVDWVTIDMEEEKGWRLMGQRFTLDGLIFQNLIFDMVRDKLDGSRRFFPTGLDVMAVYGSEPAYDTLVDLGETEYPGYTDQFQRLVDTVETQTEEQWTSRFYDGWNYGFLSILAPKDDSFPNFMQTEAWSFKDLNAALGSWAQLKHDTVLYNKMPEGAGGGGPPTSGPAPGYVEPNPEAFYRLSYIAELLSDGLMLRGYEATSIGGLAENLQTLGQIAEKELRGEVLTEDDHLRISGAVSFYDKFGTASDYFISELIEVPVIAAVSGAEDSVLEVGVGYVDRIYVVVPINGTLQIAQGGVFSYYELIQPRSDRLTDEDWRALLLDNPPDLPSWSDQFVFSGGQPVYRTAFRIGDVYYVTEEGDDLLWKETPGISGAVIGRFYAGEYVQIVDGPVSADSYTWWKVKSAFDWGDDAQEGWIAVQQDWLARSW
jgi:hypothetical protein